jgi:SH3-like domain-containing protein
MKYRVLVAGFVCVFLSACVGATPTVMPTVLPPTVAPLPTPTIIPTSAPVQVNLQVTAEQVNSRRGPGMVYELINELKSGQSVRVIGRDPASDWWYIRDPGNPNGFCWVSSSVTQVSGDVEKLPVIQPSAATVTKVSLRAEPDRIVVGCDKFPQTIFLEAKITTDGPTFVTWNWEASTGVSSQNAIMVFEGAGTQVINDYYQIGAPNEYWIKLHILAPVEITEQVNIPVTCTQ